MHVPDIYIFAEFACNRDRYIVVTIARFKAVSAWVQEGNYMTFYNDNVE